MQTIIGTATMFNGSTFVLGSPDTEDDWSVLEAGSLFAASGDSMPIALLSLFTSSAFTAWDSGEADYATGDLVSHSSHYYVALSTMPAASTPATSPAYWWECSPIGLTLAAAYTGTTKSGSAYSLSVDFTASHSLPLLHPGDTQTSALFSKAMLKLDSLLTPTVDTSHASGQYLQLAFTASPQLIEWPVTHASTVISTPTGMALGRSIVVKLYNSSGGAKNVTFPASSDLWKWLPAIPGAPYSFPDGKTAMLRLTCFGTTSASIVAEWLVQT